MINEHGLIVECAYNQLEKELDNLEIEWKHRYIVTVKEERKNNVQITHLFEVYPYEEGTRLYWNVKHYPPENEFIKIYKQLIDYFSEIY